MTPALFEQLLYEEESTTLDFKSEQYRFVKATDEDKSELLKDILGFANAWRRSEAYILIGVEDVRGGRGNVVGIAPTDHLDDHSLQQFVNNRTNQPVHFHYEAFGFEGKQVGIIRIDELTRPSYLKRDYGKLKKEEVYVRRGSSTDRTKPASPEEIPQMRVESSQSAPDLVVEFADLKRDDSLGDHLTLDAEFCEMPPKKSIPDLTHLHFLNPGLSRGRYDPWGRLNEGYYRELADYEFIRRIFQPLRLLVKNTGQVAASNVRAELILPANAGFKIREPWEILDPPRRNADFLRNEITKGIRPAFRREPGEVTIDKNDERIRVEIECGNLQPGRKVWSDVLYVGNRTTGSVELTGQIFAENLPQPKSFGLTISVNVNTTKMTVADLLRLPEPSSSDD